MPCPFCALSPPDLVAERPLTVAIRDRHPVSRGHTLVIPRRHVETYFEATAAEQAELWALVASVKAALDEQLHPDGYNVGFNAGAAAGQTVMHLHVHVIPRWTGDMDDPRGGVRHVIPGKGNYLVGAKEAGGPAAGSLSTGGAGDPFLKHLAPLLDDADEVAIVAAFVQESGLVVLEAPLQAAVERGARVRILTGDYLNITQPLALAKLLQWTRNAEARRSAAGGVD